jgi:hypothetical protein
MFETNSYLVIVYSLYHTAYGQIYLIKPLLKIKFYHDATRGY